MVRIGLIAATFLALASPGTAAAAPCAGFADVEDTNAFCPNVEWLKNRAITLGRSSTTAYCPGDPVSRLAMAAFMNRLGKALTPVALRAQAGPGALDLDLTPVVCTTVPYPLADFPRRALVDATVAGIAGSSVDIGATAVYSLDDGATWQSMGTMNRGHVMPGRWGSVTALGNVDLDVGPNVRFGVRVSRADAGSVDVGDSHCQVRAVVHNRNGTALPL